MEKRKDNENHTLQESKGLDVNVHPLVIINISDHHTRHSVEKREGRIIGALIGQVDGRKLDIHNSFELDVSIVEDTETLDDEFFKTRLGQYSEVFPDYDFLGWYSTGTAPTEKDLRLHGRMELEKENIFCILLDPGIAESSKLDLPLKVYEQVHTKSGEKTFQEVKYLIESLEAERIAVDYVTNSGAPGSNNSQHFNSAASVTNAIVMLRTRVKHLVCYLKGVKDGEFKRDHTVLREIKRPKCLKS
eukprot:Platyproteum_vivax@DN984_c0_g1_i1.p1